MLVGKFNQPIRPKRKDIGEVSPKRAQIPGSVPLSPSSEHMSSESGLNKSPLKLSSNEIAFKGSFFSLYKEAGKYDINKFLNEMDKPLDGMVRKLYNAVTDSKFTGKVINIEGDELTTYKKTIPTLVAQGAADPFLRFPGDMLNGAVELLGKIKPFQKWSEKTLEKPMFKNIRHRSKIDYEVNALQGLLDFKENSLKDALKTEAKKLGTDVDKLTTADKARVEAEVEKNMEWLIFQRSMKPFDPKVGNYDTKHERALNRLVSGLPPAIFLANDAYNLSRMMDDDPKAATEEKRTRFKQEVSRILTSGYLTLITMGALSKLINNSKGGIMLNTALTVLATEMYSRLKNGKHITRLTPEEARKINEKNNAPEAKIKPETPTSFKANANNEKSSQDKTQKPLLSFDTVLKASAAVIAAGFTIKGIRKIPRVDAAFEAVFKPFKKLYKDMTAISDYKVSQKQIDEAAETLIERGYKTRGEQYRAVAIRSRELVVEKVVKELDKSSDIGVIEKFIKNTSDNDVHKEVFQKSYKSLLDVLDKTGHKELANKYRYTSPFDAKSDKNLIAELNNIKSEFKALGESNADLISKISANKLGKEFLSDETVSSKIKTALEKTGDKNGKLYQDYKDALEGLVNFGARDKKVKPLVDFFITPFSFMWSVVKFPYKIANLAVEMFAQKAPQSAKSMDALNMEAVSKSFDKISAEAKKYRDALSKATDENAKKKICKKFEDFVMDNTLKAFNVNSSSNVSNAELSNLAKTAASAATIWFLMTDNYNMVMLKSNGNDVEGAETKFKERFVQEGSRLFYQTLLIDLFNKTFQKQYNGSLMGMSWITLTNTTIGEFLTRKSIGVPIGMHTRDELLALEEKQNNATGFEKDYYEFMKRLTGKRSIQSYNVKRTNNQPQETKTISQDKIVKSENLNFTDNQTFGKMIKG